MNTDQLKDKIEDIDYWQEQFANKTFMKALLAVLEIHKPEGVYCFACAGTYDDAQEYPCPTVEAIEKALS